MAFNYSFQSQYQQHHHPHQSSNLQVPYKINTPNGLPPNTMVTIMGEVDHRADRFSINLTSGSEILLHINPRFQQGSVVRNSRQLGSWGPEETHGGLPLVRGQQFGCIILAQYDKYMIAFNGQHFTEYQFRGPNNVTSVEISGDIRLHRVDVSSNPAIPMPRPDHGGLQPLPPVGGQDETVIYRAQVPFQAKLGGGMTHGRQLMISCTPKEYPQRIRIDLQKDKDGSEIALHIDIRFHIGEHRRIICMNNYRHGHWGEEARFHEFPFVAGVGFDLTIQSQQTGYLIYANGAQIAFFEHREKHLKSVNFLHVQGDLKITKVSF